MHAAELTQGLFRVLETGDVDMAVKVVAPDFVNREARVSPLACQLPARPAHSRPARGCARPTAG